LLLLRTACTTCSLAMAGHSPVARSTSTIHGELHQRRAKAIASLPRTRQSRAKWLGSYTSSDAVHCDSIRYHAPTLMVPLLSSLTLVCEQLITPATVLDQELLALMPRIPSLLATGSRVVGMCALEPKRRGRVAFVLTRRRCLVHVAMALVFRLDGCLLSGTIVASTRSIYRIQLSDQSTMWCNEFDLMVRTNITTFES